MEQTLRLD